MALRVLYILVISSLATMPPRDVIARRGTAFSREIAMGLTALAMEKGVGNVLWGGGYSHQAGETSSPLALTIFPLTRYNVSPVRKSVQPLGSAQVLMLG